LPLCGIRDLDAVQQISPLFDHLVGAGKQGWRHIDAERLGSV
jgi:hypothetical protein